LINSLSALFGEAIIKSCAHRTHPIKINYYLLRLLSAAESAVFLLHCPRAQDGGIAADGGGEIPFALFQLTDSSEFAAVELVRQKNNLTYGLQKGIFRAIAL